MERSWRKLNTTRHNVFCISDIVRVVRSWVGTIHAACWLECLKGRHHFEALGV